MQSFTQLSDKPKFKILNNYPDVCGQFNINKFCSVEIHINVKNLTQRYNLELVLWIVFKESPECTVLTATLRRAGKQRVQDSVFF